MDPITGGLVSTGIKGLFGIGSANKAYTRQKEMMKNAHQWEVQDLRKAGLNPILSATGGNGASASAPASADTPDLDLASASAAKNELKIAQQNADTNKQNADTQKNVGESTVKSNNASADFSSANANYVSAQKLKADIESNNLKEWLPKLYEAQIDNYKAQAMGALTTSTASAYKDYETGAFAKKQADLADFTLKSDLKYGKEGVGGWLSKFSDYWTDNADSSANGGNVFDNIYKKMEDWTNNKQKEWR